MKRLTFEGNFCDIAQCSEVRYGSFCEDGYCSQRRVWEKLKRYEDLEEQGRLVELPTKNRTRVWLTEWWKNSFEWERLSVPIERHIIYFSIETDGVYAHFKDGCLNTKYFGTVAFSTCPEAEAALAASGKEG